ncbi:MAG: glycosyltransferase [Bacilli bacterium]|jgi:hypothetical protein
MRVFIVFNHPAPYKVLFFNELGKHVDLHVIFERGKASDRNVLFYDQKPLNFTTHEIKGINLGKENHLSGGVVKHLKENEYDLIIINGYSTLTEMKTLKYLKKHKIPYAFYVNGGQVRKETRLKYKIKRRLISGAMAYFSSGEETNNYLMHYGAPKELIYNYPYSTISDKQISSRKKTNKEKRDFWSKKGINAEKVFICLTSFIKRKNNELLLEEWRDQPSENHLVLVGDGKLKNKYKKYIKKHNLTNVHLFPFVTQHEGLELLSYADYGVYVSNYDIYGHVINESLSQGLSIIASDNMNATKQLINDDVNALVYKKGTNFAELLEKLQDKDFYEEAIKTAKNNTIERMVETHLKIFKEITKQ